VPRLARSPSRRRGTTAAEYSGTDAPSSHRAPADHNDVDVDIDDGDDIDDVRSVLAWPAGGGRT
jgi:hypothetical protein